MPSPLTSPAALTEHARDVVGVDAVEHEARAAVAAARRQQAREREDGGEVPACAVSRPNTT